ncbi:MAG: hypothetical protein E6R03_01805 [Hyphomicrobiaceae bacterium]|nr:MAG: hypothetical protein E6R03_01805 [Hyphomicrobiaceae bacterium]
MNLSVQTPSRDLTHADLSSHLGPVTSRGAILATFEYVRVAVKSRIPGRRNSLETRLAVRLKPMGERYSEVLEQITEEDAQRLYPQEFSHFKNYQDVPTRGTPLSELPGMSQSMIGLCVINGLRSVEDLAAITDDAAAQCGLDVSSAHRLAVRWVGRRDQNIAVIDDADERARIMEMNRILTDRLTSMEATIRAMEIAATQNRGAVSVPPEYRGEMAGSVPAGDFSDLPDLPVGGGVVDGSGDLGGDPDPLR